MGKRSDFTRIERDYYRTFDPRAAQALQPHVSYGDMYIEPCAGDGSLIRNLDRIGLSCAWAFDVQPNGPGIDKRDVLALHADLDNFTSNCEWVITNPPWTRSVLHPMIRAFTQQKPTWLLFDAGWMFTAQAAPFLPSCVKIVTIGRLKWIEGTTMTGKDDCCWYLFDERHKDGPKFYGRNIKAGTFE
jgi:hypothetical protein